MDENGRVPWRTEEMYGNLRRAFESYNRRGTFGRNDILGFAAWLTHYVSDAHVPFHAVLNYDGQLSNQHGIHARFETYLFERYRNQLTTAPKPIAPIANPRDFIFETVLVGTRLVPPILASDLQAIGSREVYDDAYYAAFFNANRTVLERRLNEAIAATAAMIAGAWEAAGRPRLPLDAPRPRSAAAARKLDHLKFQPVESSFLARAAGVPGARTVRAGVESAGKKILPLARQSRPAQHARRSEAEPR